MKCPNCGKPLHLATDELDGYSLILCETTIKVMEEDYSAFLAWARRVYTDYAEHYAMRPTYRDYCLYVTYDISDLNISVSAALDKAVADMPQEYLEEIIKKDECTGDEGAEVG